MQAVLCGVVQGGSVSYRCVLGETGYCAITWRFLLLCSEGDECWPRFMLSQAVDTGVVMIGDIDNI